MKKSYFINLLVIKLQFAKLLTTLDGYTKKMQTENDIICDIFIKFHKCTKKEPTLIDWFFLIPFPILQS